MKYNRLLVGVAMTLSAMVMKAEIKLPHMFGDNMVMQRNSDCNIWGTADALKTVKITTSWNGKTYKVKVGDDGKWKLKISTPDAGGPYDISLSDGKALTLHNILIGEVWICSGQSNMEMPMKGFKAQPVDGALHELITGADKDLRLFTVSRNARLQAVDTLQGKWNAADAETIRQFSATAYYFGSMLRKSLRIPVGLIVTSWGGSACEAWMSSDWLKAFPDVKLPTNEKDVDKLAQRCPTALYNGMLRPLIGFTMRGVIWYQGEDNVNRASSYSALMQKMVSGWRNEWKEGSFPFYYCQIAPYDYSLINWNYNSAYLREQQSMVENNVDNCRMAVLMDAGLQYGIHPRKKREAGERLAMLALKNTYNVNGLPEFAAYSGVKFDGDTAVVSFSRSREWVYFNNSTSSDLFEVAGADKVFHPAKAWISRNQVYVKSDEVKHPVAVRYAFHDWAVGDLFHDGLPVSSFRTDNW
ncbi:sialate O-acetylesterase [Prevotella sp.]|uniref:sialate O-acetylesterase n=1 Tax=Prevotella sp. TaxID=59823 RepID=UPI003DA363A8